MVLLSFSKVRIAIRRGREYYCVFNHYAQVGPGTLTRIEVVVEGNDDVGNNNRTVWKVSGLVANNGFVNWYTWLNPPMVRPMPVTLGVPDGHLMNIIEF